MKEVIAELSIKLKKEGDNYALEVIKQGDMSDFAFLGEILRKSNNKASTGVLLSTLAQYIKKD
mgnify:CR=1 FL=1|jgi:hypothetical protein